MKPTDAANLHPGQKLIWHKPGHSTAVTVEYVRPGSWVGPNGRIYVVLPDGRERHVSLRNCTLQPKT